MRIVIDIMIGLMVVAVITTGVYLYNRRAQDEQAVQAVREALAQLEKQAAYHTTVQSAMSDQDVLLVHIDERWFGEHVPSNVLLDGPRPWIDLAPPGDVGEHPPDPVVTREGQAGFWYNPTTGTFRARVAPGASEATTLQRYNAVNGTALPGFDVIPDTSRQPLAHQAGKTPARQYASMANKTWSEPSAKDEELATDLITAEALDTKSEQAAAVGEQAGTRSDQPRNNQPDDLSGASSPAEADTAPKARPTLKNLDTKPSSH